MQVIAEAPEVSVRTTLDALNTMPAADFATALGEVFEHAPWVAAGAAPARPFATIAALHETMIGVVRRAAEEAQLGFIKGHPELAGKLARAGDMTQASQAEQGGLGLDRLSGPEFEAFGRLNAAYRAKFGFPFIICVRRHTRDSILAQFARRLDTTPAQERASALDEIGFITRLRLAALVSGPGAPKTEGRLSTHVLDTVRGRPAAGVRVVLSEIGQSATAILAEARTNADGRTDAPLLSGGPLRIGRYELNFHIGPYFAEQGRAGADPPFFDWIPIRFAIAEPEAHYHVPLLATPWTYSTYRGS